MTRKRSLMARRVRAGSGVKISKACGAPGCTCNSTVGRAAASARSS